jgi:hypothetical protein
MKNVNLKNEVNNANMLLSVISFIEREIEIIKSKRDEHHWNTSEFSNLDRRLDSAKLFHDWVISKYR